MAITAEQGLKKANELEHCTSMQRLGMESFFGLAMLYTYGKGWGRISGTAGIRNIESLSPVMSTSSGAVRTSINKIRPRVEKDVSRLIPRVLDYTVTPGSGAMNDQMAALVGDKRLQLYKAETKDLLAFVTMNHWRVVLGSCIITRDITPDGPRTFIRDPAGNPILDEKGDPRWIWPSLRFGWQVCPPYEFIRDPSAYSPDFAGETCIGQEKPISLAELSSVYRIDLKTDMTMGQLTDLRQFLAQNTTMGAALGSAGFESKEPGVMLARYFFRDPKAPEETGWNRRMLCYRDAGAREGARDYKLLHFGPNPHYQLPLHHYTYSRIPGQPWGEGIATQVMQEQDLYNLGISLMAQALIFHGGQQYDVEEGVLTDTDIKRLLGKPNQVRIYRSGTRKEQFVSRSEPSKIDPNAMAMIQSTDPMLDSALNQSPAGRGAALSRRENPVGTYRMALDAGDTVIDMRAHIDELATDGLLLGSLWDVKRQVSIDQLREELSGDFDDGQLMAFLQQDDDRPRLAVRITPDSLRPKTPDETRQEYIQSLQLQLVDPRTARRAIFKRSGLAIDPSEGLAWRMQEMEMKLILDGQPVPVAEDQNHDCHMDVLRDETEHPRWLQYTEEQRKAVQDHRREHDGMKQTMLAFRQPEGPEGQEGASEQVEPQAQGQGTIPFPQQPPADSGQADFVGGEAGMPGAEPAWNAAM